MANPKIYECADCGKMYSQIFKKCPKCGSTKKLKESVELEEAKAKNCPQCGIKYNKMSKEEGFCVECATPIKEAKDVSQGSWTAKKGNNTNTFDVYLNGKYQYNIGAETSERAITLAKQQYKEIYKNPTVMDSNIAHCLTILEGGIPNSSGIRDALDKVITGDADLTDRERLTLLKYKLIGDNGKPTQLAKDEFSEMFESLNEGYATIATVGKDDNHRIISLNYNGKEIWSTEIKATSEEVSKAKEEARLKMLKHKKENK